MQSCLKQSLCQQGGVWPAGEEGHLWGAAWGLSHVWVEVSLQVLMRTGEGMMDVRGQDTRPPPLPHCPSPVCSHVLTVSPSPGPAPSPSSLRLLVGSDRECASLLNQAEPTLAWEAASTYVALGPHWKGVFTDL